MNAVIGPLWDKTTEKDVQGIVKIKRKTVDSETGDSKEGLLEFKSYSEFKILIEKDNQNKTTESLRYFAIDENWMLCVSKYIKKITKNIDANGNQTEEIKLTVKEVKIPYQTMISQYSVPFEFFMALQQITR